MWRRPAYNPLMSSSPEAAIVAALARWPPGALCVALSGGLDSTALAHALAANADARARGLRCVHVDHGLHPDSARWSAQCAAFAASLALPFTSTVVTVQRDAGHGVEAAARSARYDAFAAALREGELLVTAHHAGDQAETLLLRLMRGAGIAGLAAMRPLRALAAGHLARPWLDVPRSAIRAYAQRHALAWIEDPSNESLSHDRNFLRARVLPLLETRWPHASRSLARSAGLLREVAGVTAGVVARELALAQALDPATLRLDALRALEPFLRAEVVRAWIDGLGLPPPPASTFEQLRTLLDARGDGEPRLAWAGAELRRHRDLVHAMAPLPPIDPAWSAAWDGREPLALPAALGTLALEPGDAAVALRVAFRAGGERMQVARSRPRRAVRDLMQELGVPPWERERLPFVFDREGLVAIGDLLVAERFPGKLRWARGTTREARRG